MSSPHAPAERPLGLHSLPDDLLLAILRLLPETYERSLQLSPGAKERTTAEPGDNQGAHEEEREDAEDEKASRMVVTSRQAG